MATSIVDEYLGKVRPEQRKMLTEVRKIIKEIVPEAEETIRYGMPTYNYHGRRLISFAAFKNHMSLFGKVGPIENKIAGFKLTHKGTIQFTVANPLPDELVKEIVKSRLHEITPANNP